MTAPAGEQKPNIRQVQEIFTTAQLRSGVWDIGFGA